MVAAVKKQSIKSSPIKQKQRRPRRSKDQIAAIRDSLFDLLEAENLMTVRQVFYRMVSLSVIEKTEAAYKGIVCRLLTAMRREGVPKLFYSK